MSFRQLGAKNTIKFRLKQPYFYDPSFKCIFTREKNMVIPGNQANVLEIVSKHWRVHSTGNSSLLHIWKSTVCARAPALGFSVQILSRERSQQHPCRRVSRDGKAARKLRRGYPALISLTEKEAIREKNTGFLDSRKSQGHLTSERHADLC